MTMKSGSNSPLIHQNDAPLPAPWGGGRGEGGSTKSPLITTFPLKVSTIKTLNVKELGDQKIDNNFIVY